MDHAASCCAHFTADGMCYPLVAVFSARLHHPGKLKFSFEFRQHPHNGVIIMLLPQPYLRDIDTHGHGFFILISVFLVRGAKPKPAVQHCPLGPRIPWFFYLGSGTLWSPVLTKFPGNHANVSRRARGWNIFLPLQPAPASKTHPKEHQTLL